MWTAFEMNQFSEHVQYSVSCNDQTHRSANMPGRSGYGVRGATVLARSLAIAQQRTATIQSAVNRPTVIATAKAKNAKAAVADRTLRRCRGLPR